MLNWSGWILGYNTVCAKESRALQTNWSSSLCIDVTGSRDLFLRYQCWFRRQGRKYSTQSAITFLTDSISRDMDMDVRVRFFGKIQIRISESKSRFPNPKTDFEFIRAYPKTDHESIKSTLRVDSLDQIQIRIFEIHNLSVFMRKDLKKVFLTSVFSQKKMIWTYVGGALLSLSHITPCLSSIQIIGRLFLNPYLSVFCTYVVSAYAGLFSKLKIKQFIGFNFKFL